MKRFVILASMLAACGGTPAPQKVDVPQAPSDVVPEKTLPPIALENPDLPTMYHYPVEGAPVPMASLGAEEIQLANGMRALLVRRDDAPVVLVHVVLRWKTPLPTYPVPISAVLFDASGKTAKSLRQTMADRGAPISLHLADHDVHILDFAAIPTLLESSLSGLVESFSHPISPANNLEELRKRFPPKMATNRVTLWARVEEALHPAGSPFHDFAQTPDPASIKLDQVVRFRDSAISPDMMTICVVGNVSREALTGMLERATQNWKVPRTAEKPWPLVKLPQGVFLFESTEHKGGAILSPGPSRAAVDEYVGDSVARNVLFALLDEARKDEAVAYDTEQILHRGQSIAGVRTDGDTAQVLKFVQQTIAAMKRIAAGEFSAEHRAAARRSLTSWTLRQRDTYTSIGGNLAIGAAYGGEAEILTKLHNAALDMSKDEIVRYAQKWLRIGDIRIVATGDTNALKTAFEGLEIQPVTVASDKGKKK